MIAGIFAAPDAAVAVPPFMMAGHQHAFCGDRPLHRSILVVIQADHFIDRPAERAVVNDDVLVIPRTEGIIFTDNPVSESKTHITHNDIVGFYGCRIIGYGNAITRCGLAGNRQIGAGDLQRLLQTDRSSHTEYDRPVAPAYRIAERTGNRRFVAPVISQRCNLIHSLCPAAGYIFAAALCTRKAGSASKSAASAVPNGTLVARRPAISSFANHFFFIQNLLGYMRMRRAPAVAGTLRK